VRTNGFGVTGYCLGGTYTFVLAIAAPEIRAAAPYYGTVDATRLARSQAAYLIFHGEQDTRITSQAFAVETALKQAGRPVEVHIEPGAGHAFFANTRTSH
jgi:carboxymethylenebutenolidase